MINKWLNKIVDSHYLLYTFRCVLGFVIGYALFKHFAIEELFWTLISIVLVISPEEKDTRRMSFDRFKSNVIGSGVGLICFLIHPPNAYMMIAGIIVTTLICHLLNMANMARVAIVALLIILSWHQSDHSQFAPIYRFLTVALGCIIGLTIVVTTSWLKNKIKGSHL
ncbi:uncharacterized membrane protein YgaE (UPF0421/DUF939 family) [Pedobacter sp. CAN_A7]|uniref:FUSC family protein n=1 Tax=Pedobacter sp. CAN_A7 TaxID=2787722 RepID=UPI0018CBC8B0